MYACMYVCMHVCMYVCMCGLTSVVEVFWIFQYQLLCSCGGCCYCLISL